MMSPCASIHIGWQFQHSARTYQWGVISHLGFHVVVTMLTAVALTSGLSAAQDTPSRPIRIVTSAAGGAADFLSRLIAQGISGPLNAQVIVDNRTGLVSIETAVKAQPDGHTLLMQSNLLWLSPFLQKVFYNPVSDLAPITLTALGPSVLVLHPSVPANSVKELAALAKAKSGQLNYSSAGPGAVPHLGMELFKVMAGVDIVRVAYKGTTQAMTSLLAAEVHMMLANTAQAAPHVKSGRLRALAVSSSQPTAMFPELPTMAAAGLPGYEAVSSYGVFAPAKTPGAVINRLNREIVRYLRMPTVKVQLLNAGMDTAGSTPEELSFAVRSDMRAMGKLIMEAGIRAE